MKESAMMYEIRKIKEELSEQAKKMTKEEFLKFIKKEAAEAKLLISQRIATK